MTDEVKTAFFRHELHRIPESGYKEFKTQKYITDTLGALNLLPEKCAGTGVICFIDMKSEHTIALRCDMDGLCLEEDTPLEFRSVHPKMMHACGHDAHMSMLLSLARKIVKEKLSFKHNVLLIFQPAEEGPGGASEVIKEGVLERYNVEAVLAMHLSPDYENGRIALRMGEFFAGGVELYFKIKGASSHGAQPEKGRSALLAGALLALKLNEKIARNIERSDGVMSLGSFNAGTTMNIIAGEAQLSGILRTFNIDKRNEMLDEIRSVCNRVAKNTGCSVSFEPVLTYPPLKNDESLASKVFDILGGNAVEAKKTMLTEDFAEFALVKPSVMMLLGVRDDTHREPLHSPRFDFDEAVLDIGVSYYIELLKAL